MTHFNVLSVSSMSTGVGEMQANMITVPFVRPSKLSRSTVVSLVDLHGTNVASSLNRERTQSFKADNDLFTSIDSLTRSALLDVTVLNLSEP